MKCFNEKIYSLFLDNELNPRERKEVISHLKECEKCRKIVESLKLENLKIKKSFEVDYKIPDLTTAIMEKIATREPYYRKEKILWHYLVYGFSIIIGVLAPYFIIKYIKSTFIFHRILSYIFTPISFIFSSISFLLKEIFLLDSINLDKIIISQIFLVAFLFINLIGYLIEKLKIKEETK